MKKYSEGFKFERTCPSCNETIIYQSYQGYETGIKRNSKCKKCGCGWMKGQTKETNEIIKTMSEKVSNTWKEKFDDGYIVWNKGLTKDESDILKKSGEKRKGKKHTGETKKIIGEHTKKCWENGIFDN
jgi:hypothetical protein